MDITNVKQAYRCGGGNKDIHVDLIAIKLDSGETKYIEYKDGESIEDQVKKFIIENPNE